MAASLPLKGAIRSSTLMLNLSKSVRYSASLSPSMNRRSLVTNSTDSKVPDSTNTIFSGTRYDRFYDVVRPRRRYSVKEYIHNHDDTDDETDDIVEKFVTFPKSWQNYSVKSDENALRIRMDMPGISKEDVNIDLEVDTNKLLIQGGAEIVKYDLENHVIEDSDSDDEETCSRCYFSKVQMLPTRYKIDEIKANFDSGVLMITVPKMVGINQTLKRIQVA